MYSAFKTWPNNNWLSLLFPEGNYMYIEASGQSVGSVARLMTSSVTPSPGISNYCWFFQYHMYGDQMGTLNVKVSLVSP